MERTEKTIEKARQEGGKSASLSANIWHDMQSTPARGGGESSSISGNAGACAQPDVISNNMPGGPAGQVEKPSDSIVFTPVYQAPKS